MKGNGSDLKRRDVEFSIYLVTFCHLLLLFVFILPQNFGTVFFLIFLRTQESLLHPLIITRTSVADVSQIGRFVRFLVSSCVLEVNPECETVGSRKSFVDRIWRIHHPIGGGTSSENHEGRAHTGINIMLTVNSDTPQSTQCKLCLVQKAPPRIIVVRSRTTRFVWRYSGGRRRSVCFLQIQRWGVCFFGWS